MDRLYFGGNENINNINNINGRGIYNTGDYGTTNYGTSGYGEANYGMSGHGRRTGYGGPEDYGDLMEISSYCSRFERRGDFDLFSMDDYQSCENCRHLAHDDRCIVK